jgi:universal stress protein E
MTGYSRILVITDAAMRPMPALAQAVELARKAGASLQVVAFGRDLAITSEALLDKDWSQRSRKSWMEERRQWLETQVASLSKLGVPVDVEIEWAYIGLDNLLMQVVDRMPDIVIKDFDEQPEGKASSLDLRFMRHCRVPLLLVHRDATGETGRIFAAVSASPRPERRVADQNVLIQAQAFALHCAAELHLIHANRVVDERRVAAMARRERFEALADEFLIPTGRQHLLRGPPAQTVADFIGNRPSDILVVGTLRHTLYERIFGGDEAERLINLVPCNLLAVK